LTGEIHKIETKLPQELNELVEILESV